MDRHTIYCKALTDLIREVLAEQDTTEDITLPSLDQMEDD
jgi:hypothetical protein